jgi:hypothetical protein
MIQVLIVGVGHCGEVNHAFDALHGAVQAGPVEKIASTVYDIALGGSGCATGQRRHAVTTSGEPADQPAANSARRASYEYVHLRVTDGIP